MKKIVYSVCLTALLMYGCKSGTTETADEKPGISSKTDADAIIVYTNALLDALKNHSEAAEKMVKYYEELGRYWSGKSPYTTQPGDMNFLNRDGQDARIAFGKAPASLGDTRAFFQDSAAKYNRYFNTFIEQDSILSLYVKSEDFKDDKYAKGKELIEKQLIIYPSLARLRFALEEKIETVADAAEEVTLKDSPLKDAFKAAKSDLASMRTLCGLIINKESFTDGDIAAIESNHTALLASIEKNKAIDKTNLKKASKTKYYEIYYNTISNSSAELKPVIRNIKTTRKLSEHDYDAVNRNFESVVRYYNMWVN